MKKWKILIPVFMLVFFCIGCSGDDSETVMEVEKNIESEQSEEANAQKTYTLSSETEDISIEISVPGEFQDTEYLSESWLALEIPGDDEESSTQLMMYLEADGSVDVKKNMVEEVNYLMSANTDDWEEIDYVEGVSAGCHEWAYVTYELEGLKGYKFCGKMENNTVLAGTVELIGESPKAFDIITFIRQIDETIVAD